MLCIFFSSQLSSVRTVAMGLTTVEAVLAATSIERPPL